MLKKLEIDNFKTLNHFEMVFSPMTVIVGNNASGKSTILQVLSLLSASVQEDFDAFFYRRGWNISDLRSKCKKKAERELTAAVEVELSIEGEVRNLRWELRLLYVLQKNTFTLLTEKVYDIDRGEVLLDFDSKGTELRSRTGELVIYPKLMVESSVLKVVLDGGADSRQKFPELDGLKQFLVHMHSYELLSPEQMRTSSRGEAEYLSISGKNLPTYLKSMSEEKRRRFLEKIKKLLGDKIEDVSTETKGKPGWVYMTVEEKYRDVRYKISSSQLSDGLLRLLAIVGISESGRCSLSMLDEIENGINSSYAEDLIEILHEVSRNETQLVITTHSVVFLDYVDKNEIVFLYRTEQDGSTIAIRPFELPELSEKLEYMYPGEIFYNLGNSELVECCMKHTN